MTASRKDKAADRLEIADYRLLAEFRRHLRGFTAFSEQAARAAGLTPQQHQALLAIKGFAEPRAPTVGDLARVLLIRHHSAVELVDRLVEARLLVRYLDNDDRRRVELVLTRRADALLAELSHAHRGELRRLAPVLKALLATLER